MDESVDRALAQLLGTAEANGVLLECTLMALLVSGALSLSDLNTVMDESILHFEERYSPDGLGAVVRDIALQKLESFRQQVGANATMKVVKTRP